MKRKDKEPALPRGETGSSLSRFARRVGMTTIEGLEFKRKNVGQECPTYTKTKARAGVPAPHDLGSNELQS